MGPTPARPGKLRTYLQLGRVSNLPTVWTNVLAGLVLAGGQARGSRFFILELSLSCSYIGGMFLNDVFDRDYDRRFRPERPIPSGAASAQEVLAIGVGLLATGFLVLLSFVHEGGWQLVAAGVMLALLILFYDLHHKQNPWSPLIMAGCRAMIYLIAAFSLASVLPTSLLVGAAAVFTYILGVSSLARFETGARPRPLWPFALLWAPFAVALPGATGTLETVFLILGVSGWLAYVSWRSIRAEGPKLRQATGLWLAGISLLDAALIASQGQLDLAVYASIGGLGTIALHRWINGT